MNDSAFQPLVSVPVVTYNSSKTVLETLDSIYNQTYQNLELIVSDDCSTDNTVEICREWIEAHKERFVRTELLTVGKNTGVSGNMNRGEAACRGEWVKPIAGDDILLPDCIDIYLQYISTHPDASFVFSSIRTFGNSRYRDDVEKDYITNRVFFEWSTKRQMDYLRLERNCLPAASFFYCRAQMLLLGVKNDERIPYIEDWPKWINLLERGARFHFVEEVTVLYRTHEESLSITSNHSNGYVKSLFLFYINYQYKAFVQAGRKKEAIKRYVQAKKVITGSLFWRVLYSFVKRIL